MKKIDTNGESEGIKLALAKIKSEETHFKLFEKILMIYEDLHRMDGGQPEKLHHFYRCWNNHKKYLESEQEVNCYWRNVENWNHGAHR